jgi:transcriptional regulator of arginine metabolism
MSVKLERQNLIKEILNTYFIPSQQELSKILERNGTKITQATLSRDFGEMGVIRTVTDMGVRYILSSDESGKKIAALVGFEILNVQSNESLVVMRTLAGRAQGVAHFIDRLNKTEILGTIGGDDTVIVIPDKQSSISVIEKLIKNMMADNLNKK